MAARKRLNDVPRTHRPTGKGVGGYAPHIKDMGGYTPAPPHGPADTQFPETKGMSTAELKKVVDRLALELRERQRPSKQDRDLALFSDAVHEVMLDQLAGNLAGNAGPLAVRQLFQSEDVWGPISAFLDRTGYLRLTPAEKAVVYRFLADLVVRHATQVSRRSRAPMSPKLVASCSGNLGGLFEREFPGYLRSGLAGVVARSLCQPRVQA